MQIRTTIILIHIPLITPYINHKNTERISQIYIIFVHYLFDRRPHQNCGWEAAIVIFNCLGVGQTAVLSERTPFAIPTAAVSARCHGTHQTDKNHPFSTVFNSAWLCEVNLVIGLHWTVLYEEAIFVKWVTRQSLVKFYTKYTKYILLHFRKTLSVKLKTSAVRFTNQTQHEKWSSNAYYMYFIHVDRNKMYWISDVDDSKSWTSATDFCKSLWQGHGQLVQIYDEDENSWLRRELYLGTNINSAKLNVTHCDFRYRCPQVGWHSKCVAGWLETNSRGCFLEWRLFGDIF